MFGFFVELDKTFMFFPAVFQAHLYVLTHPDSVT